MKMRETATIPSIFRLIERGEYSTIQMYVFDAQRKHDEIVCGGWHRQQM